MTSDKSTAYRNNSIFCGLVIYFKLKILADDKAKAFTASFQFHLGDRALRQHDPPRASLVVVGVKHPAGGENSVLLWNLEIYMHYYRNHIYVKSLPEMLLCESLYFFHQ